MSEEHKSEREGIAAGVADTREASDHNKWESPLLLVSSLSCRLCDADHHPDTDSIKKKEITSIVTVPCDGYYSVSFGYARPIHCGSAVGKRKRGSNKAAARTTNTTTASDTSVNNTDMAHLHIHKKEEGAERMRQLDLPWREEDGDADTTGRENKKKSNRQKLAFGSPSLYLGKLLWLERQMKLSVVTSISATGSDATLPQWQVRLQHESKPGKSPSTNTAHLPKKKWVCGLCRKTFHSAFQVAQHQETSHYQQVMLQNNSNNNNNQHADQVDSSNNSNKATSSLWTKPLQVVYDDNFLAVVIKPQGMPIMGDVNGPTLQRSSLLMALAPPGLRPHHEGPKTKFPWPRRNGEDDNDNNGNGNKLSQNNTDGDDNEGSRIMDTYLGKPRPVHRLDAPTGGLLVVAKTHRTDSLLRKAFMDRHCQKIYHALVYGNVGTDTGECRQELGGKESLTRFRVVQRNRSVTSQDGCVSTVELYPHTGRQHQLRRHMQMIGHPIWGDRRYGPRIKSDQDKGKSPNAGEKDHEDEAAATAAATKNKNHWQSRLCLWAVAITFTHPVTGKEISCRMDDPEWLQQVVAHEEAEWNQKNA